MKQFVLAASYFLALTFGDEISLVDWDEIVKTVTSISAVSSDLCGDSCQTGVERQCSCDHSCVRAGDCCVDYDFSSHHSSISAQSEEGSYTSCVETHVPGVLDSSHMIMVTSCPQNFTDQDTVELCTADNQTIKQYWYGLDIPVLSNNTVYKNIYCALCHSISVEDISAVNISVRCDNEELISQCGLTSQEILKQENYKPGK